MENKKLSFLFHLDEKINTIDHLLYKLNFTLTNASLIRYIKFSVRSRRRVFTTGTTSLKTHVVTELFKSMDTHLFVKFWQLKHDASTKTCTYIGRASGDVTIVVLVSIGKTIFTKRFLNFTDGTSPTSENILDVTTHLHRNPM